MIKKEYCEIFSECFPQFKMGDEFFCRLWKNDSWSFDICEDGICKGFVIVEGENIRLLCVRPDFQKKGIGKALLCKAEEYIKENGKTKVTLGGGSSHLFIGAPKESFDFFEKLGYKKTASYDEMMQKLSDFDINSYSFRGHEVAHFGWYQGDINKIKEAVSQVDKDWVKYYNKEDNVFVAWVGDEIASFCLVDINCDRYLSPMYGKIGMPGCVGTVPKFRNKGIAIEMIARATEYLKEKGMDISFIYYTGVASWYEKIGYKTYLTEIFASKEID